MCISSSTDHELCRSDGSENLDRSSNSSKSELRNPFGSKRRRKSSPLREREVKQPECLLSPSKNSFREEKEESILNSCDTAEEESESEHKEPEVNENELSGDALTSYLQTKLLEPCEYEFDEIARLCEDYDL